MEVKTLVELFDERPLENVLGVEIFHPEEVIYVCPEETPEHARRQLKDYFTHRGIEAAMEFLYVNIYDTQKILELFRAILKDHPDAVMDITGGTDAVLFAAGLACYGRRAVRGRTGLLRGSNPRGHLQPHDE